MFSIDVPSLLDFDPWRELDRLHREFNGSGTRSPGLAPLYPRLNIYTNAEGAFLSAQAPGLDPAQLNLSVLGDTLTISGEPRSDDFNANANATCHRRERPQTRFSRTVKLPFRVDGEKVRAEYNNGVLEVVLPRPDADKPRNISVTVS